jgi:arylsulfatase A-like enzyme
LYDETLHVPLLLAGPGVPSGTRQDELQSLVDVFPTICDAAGLQTPTDLRGESMLSSDGHDAVFAEYAPRNISNEYLDAEQCDQFSLGRKCVRTNSEKLVLRSDGVEEVYELPEESEPQKPNRDHASLREQLMTTLSQDFLSPDSTKQANEQVRENLRQLGYIE